MCSKNIGYYPTQTILISDITDMTILALILILVLISVYVPLIYNSVLGTLPNKHYTIDLVVIKSCGINIRGVLIL